LDGLSTSQAKFADCGPRLLCWGAVPGSPPSHLRGAL